MQREFIREKHGNKYHLVITIGDVLGQKMLQGVLSWNNGQSGGSRRLNSVFIEGDTLYRVEAGIRHENPMPEYMLADVLQQIGWDDGFTDLIRG